jgi:hypothetical protein
MEKRDRRQKQCVTVRKERQKRETGDRIGARLRVKETKKRGNSNRGKDRQI